MRENRYEGLSTTHTLFSPLYPLLPQLSAGLLPPGYQGNLIFPRPVQEKPVQYTPFFPWSKQSRGRQGTQLNIGYPGIQMRPKGWLAQNFSAHASACPGKKGACLVS